MLISNSVSVNYIALHTDLERLKRYGYQSITNSQKTTHGQDHFLNFPITAHDKVTNP